MGMSPYKMVYGKACHLPLELQHKAYWAVKELNRDCKLAGEKRLLDLSSLDEWRSEAYENARLFKEKVKRWHDKRILKREFHVGEKVILYRSRLNFFAGKLLSKWEGPFIIEEVYRSGAINFFSLKDNTTQVVNGQRLKHYIAGDSYNEDVDAFQVITPEKFIEDQIQRPAESVSNLVTVLVRKVPRKYNPTIFLQFLVNKESYEAKKGRKRSQGGSHHPMAWAHPWPRHQVVSPPWTPPPTRFLPVPSFCCETS